MKVIVIENKEDDTMRFMLIKEPGDKQEECDKIQKVIESMALKN